MNEFDPYISVVVASRNDDHGIGLLKRMRLFVNGLIQQANAFRLPIELIIVDWNPPEGKPLLADVLPKPEGNGFLQLKYVIVPPYVHQQFRNSEKLPFFQMIAKNAGIRRASGAFILCTNMDILLSDGLFRALSKRTLKLGFFYRAYRMDVNNELDENWEWSELMDYCRENVLLIHKKLGFMGGRLDFLLRWPASLRNILSRIYPKLLLSQVFYNACGDFTLMARDHWMEIQGHPELEMYSIHLDSLTLNQALALGLKQWVYSPELPVYHIDHEDGWSSMGPLEKIRWTERFPSLGWELNYLAGLSMLKERNLLGFNNKDWGLQKHDLEVKVIS